MINVSPFRQLDPRTLYRILRLRSEVFVVEQACPYNDLDGRDSDPGALHLWIDLDPSAGTVSACARLLAGEEYVLGRIVTAPAHRGGRLAGALIDRALELVPAGTAVVLNAQSRLEPWYGRGGFVRTGPDFDEDGIMHVPMRR